MRVLVGFASEHGSTRSVAERIGERLAEYGHEVETAALADGDCSALGHDAFVLGSAVHNGAWLPAADGFLRAWRTELGARPLWLYSVGMARVLGGRYEQESQEPKPLPELLRDLRPMGHQLFAGALSREHLHWYGRIMYRLLGGQYGDFRDWKEIDAWGLEIALGLSEWEEAQQQVR